MDNHINEVFLFIKLSSDKFLWLQVLVSTHRLPKPSFSRCTTCTVINLLNQLSTGSKDMQPTAAVVMDQRLGVIKGNVTCSSKIMLETFKIPSPHAALLTPSLLVTLRSLSEYSFQGVNYLPQLIWGILRDNILAARLLRGYD